MMAWVRETAVPVLWLVGVLCIPAFAVAVQIGGAS